jgi:hypothetical protein
MWDDASAYYSYPSTANRCYHCKRPAAPLRAHQQAYCLKSEQQDCPAYNQAETRPFPKKFRERAARRGPSASSARLLAIVIALAAIGFVAWRFFPQSLALLTGIPSLPATATIEPSVTPIPPTSSPVSTSTPAPTRTSVPWTHALDVPFEIDGHPLLLHRVGNGEMFDTIDSKYKTTPEVIRALNPSVAASLWADTVIVIAPGLEAVDPTLPSFRLHEVLEPTITIDELAVQYNIEAALLMRYNGCTDACQLSAGDWVLFPVMKK